MFRITNTNGRRGKDWDRTYPTKREAAFAVADAMGWLDVAISAAFATDEGTAWCCYETAEQRDADSEGAKAPRIIETGGA